MSKYTRSLPIPIISLLNKNRELIYNPYFPNMAIVGHALCVSKAKRTALACAHSEAQLSKRRTVGFYKDPVSSADDITYGLLAYYYLQDSHVAIEQFMDAFDMFVDSVPELESASVNERANVSEVSVSEREARVEASVSANVSERERESVKTATKTSTKKKAKASTKKKTGKHKSKADKTLAENERKALAKIIARTKESKSNQSNPKISIPHPNKEAHAVYAYLRSVSVDARSRVIVECIGDEMMHDKETQQRGLTFDDTARNAIQIVVNQRALKAFPPLSTDERATLIRVIYDKYVKGQTQDETTNTNGTTQDA